ncbi:MAG TPA: rhomboid family intramembrane serine protease [Planctomycetaceae bacterium]|nr:rhomboid family intramembrane serine protease [Planctomycetaceae bacterium]
MEFVTVGFQESEGVNGREVVWRGDSRREATEAKLVLTAVGIRCRQRIRDGIWEIIVGEADHSRARQELLAYEKEQRESAESSRAQEATNNPEGIGAVAGVVGFIIALILAWFVQAGTLGQEFSEHFQVAGHIDSVAMKGGQWWRSATALTLHADPGHLLSNLAFGSLFGLLIGRMMGGGLGMLAILLGGIGGNLLNVSLRASDHLAIGASTAVFAALGILVGYAAIESWNERKFRFRNWQPIIAGLVLFSMLGLGDERTDVGAHLAGMLVGLPIGIAAFWLPVHIAKKPAYQVAAAALAVALICGAWGIALSA